LTTEFTEGGAQRTQRENTIEVSKEKALAEKRRRAAALQRMTDSARRGNVGLGGLLAGYIVNEGLKRPRPAFLPTVI